MSDIDHYAVIGHPIAHSLSPQIHRAFARQTGQAMDYTAIDVADFESFWQSPQGRQLAGANITLPHKAAAFEWVGERSEAATRSSAVNTVIRLQDGRWRGDNTDGVGLLNDLERLRLPLSGRRVLLLGAGGAARGVLPALIEAGAQVSVANRTMARTEALDASYPIHIVAWNILGGKRPFDGIINATSAGHGSGLTLPATLIGPQTWCYDLSYGQPAECFCTWASAHCDQIHDGLGMLVEQAAAAFTLWRGVTPDSQSVLEQLRHKRFGLG